MGRRGVTAQYAKLEMRRRTTLIASMLLRKGEGDGMICGTISTAARHLRYIDDVIGRAPGATVYAAMNALLLPEPADFPRGHAHQPRSRPPSRSPRSRSWPPPPCAASASSRRSALLSHSNFGSSDAPSALKMRRARELIRAQSPDFEVDGEMHGDSALDEALRKSGAAGDDADGFGEPAGIAESRLGEHCLQPAQDGGRQQRRDRPDPARLRRAREHPHAVGNGAPHRQHDGTDGRFGEREPRGDQEVAAPALPIRHEEQSLV